MNRGYSDLTAKECAAQVAMDARAPSRGLQGSTLEVPVDDNRVSTQLNYLRQQIEVYHQLLQLFQDRCNVIFSADHAENSANPSREVAGYESPLTLELKKLNEMIVYANIQFERLIHRIQL